MSAEPPAVAETHISTVCFVGDRAYKILKAIDTGFLDYSTVEARLAAVDDELTLNRRLAPDVYLGSADVVEHGQLVDRILVMRRLRPGDRLARLVTEPGWERHVRSVAREVARFHSDLPPLHDVEHIAGIDPVRKNWDDNVAAMTDSVGTVLDPIEFDRVQGLYHRYLDGRRTLFEERIAQGWVRDGHGDLTAEDIFCTDDGPQILDCLAFSEALRVSDVLLDIAFLAMDLERLAGPTVAERLMADYHEFSNEHHPASLAHFFVAYRAHVRAKIACIRHRQGDPTAADLARSYHALCLRQLERGAVRLVLVGGGPATGKTTLASGISAATGWMVLGSDELRKDLTGHGHTEHPRASFGEGIYSAEVTERTYGELLDQARTLLARGVSVILDATWGSADHRRRAAEVARAHHTPLHELECTVDVAEAERRAAARAAAGLDASDATAEIVRRAMGRRDPWPTAAEIDTSVGTEPALATALRRLRI